MPSQIPPSPDLPPRGGFRPEDRARPEAQTHPQAGAASTNAGGPPPSSRRWGWIVGVSAVVLASGLIVCCGGLYFVFQLGAEQMTSQLKTRLADHPVIEAEIGEIESIEVNLQKTGERGDQERLVLTIEGSKGNGLLIGRQRPGALELEDLVLETPEGEQYPLDAEPAEAPDAPDAPVPPPAATDRSARTRLPPLE